MAAELRFLPPARNYLKKIQDKKLRDAFRKALEQINEDFTL